MQVKEIDVEREGFLTREENAIVAVPIIEEFDVEMWITAGSVQ